MARCTARHWRIVTAVALLSILTAVPAWAHAVLVGTDPADGATLTSAPGQVTLEFDEAVEAPLDAVRLYDATGARLDVGTVRAESTRVVADLPDLSDGGYVVTFRVLSADGHPVAGTLTFSVGEAAAFDDAVLADLAVEEATIGRATQALRGVTYATTLLATGLAVFLATLLRAPDRTDAVRRAAVVAAALAIVGTAATFTGQSMAVTGRAVGGVLRPDVATEMLTTGFGQAAIHRTIWLALTALLLARRAPRGVVAVTGLVALGTFAIEGHQRVVAPVAVLVSADLLHLAVGALWLGAVAGLAIVLRHRDPSSPLDAPLATVARVSTAGLVSAAGMVITGVVMAVPLVRTPAALVSTTYGRTLLVKLAAVLVVLVIAAGNRWRLVPAVLRTPDQGRAWRTLRFALGAELALLGVVFAASGVLATTPPAAQVIGATGVFVDEQQLTDDLTVQLIVDPNRVGRNAVHLYVFDATGRPTDAADGAVLELTHEPSRTGPIRIEPFGAGPGHWVANIEDLVLAGPWTIDVVVGTGRFEEVRATFTTTVVGE